MQEFAEIAYETSLRALDKQERVLEELRARTGILLAASSLAASLLGRDAFAKGSPSLVVGVALLAFVACLASSVFALLPRGGFTFALRGPTLYEELHEFTDDPAEVLRRLTYDLQRFWDGNNAQLEPVVTAFRVAAGALMVEILVLTVLVSDNL